MSMNRTCPICRRRFSSDSGGTTYLYYRGSSGDHYYFASSSAWEVRMALCLVSTPLVIPLSKKVPNGRVQGLDPGEIRLLRFAVSGQTKALMTLKAQCCRDIKQSS